MNKIIGIYKITSPCNKIYIGQSRDIEYRKRRYKNGFCKSQVKLNNSINKYGWHCHKFEIIQQCNVEELNELEKYYIKLYDSFNTKIGLNLHSGGDVNYEVSPETKSKLSYKFSGDKNPNYGKKTSDHTKQKIRLSLIGKPLSSERRQKISHALKGRIFSESTREKMSNSSFGRKKSDAFRVKLSIAKRDCSKITKYSKHPCPESQKQAQRENNITEDYRIKCRIRSVGIRNPFYGKKHSDTTKDILSAKAKQRMNTEMKTNLSKKLKGRTPWNKGKKCMPWSEQHRQKMKEIIKNRPSKNIHNKRKISQISIDNIHIKTWDTIKEASRALNVNPAAIGAALRTINKNGTRRLCLGNIWKYAS